MKIVDQGAQESVAVSYGALIERIEILRSTLRWSPRLERPEIERLFTHSTTLSYEVMRLSYKERFVTAAAEGNRVDQSLGERRQALLKRNFAFEGTFGDNPSLLEVLETAEK